MKNILLVSMLVSLLLAPLSIRAQGSKIGNETGGICNIDNDCVVGCKEVGGSPSCLKKAEAQTKCALAAPGGLRCGCLEDVKKCGYLFPSEPQVKSCAKQGEGLIPKKGGPPGSVGFENTCCAGLKHVENRLACGRAYGGYAGLCVACGDGKCDSAYESSCNCPNDCPPL